MPSVVISTGSKRPATQIHQSPRSPAKRESPASASSPSTGRRSPADEEAGRKKRRARFGEMAGETAADCAAICCCCPCGLVSLVVGLAVKLPAGLLLRALRRSRASSRKKAATLRPAAGARGNDDPGILRGHALAAPGSKETWPIRSPAEEMSELEQVMWANFYGAGFWRSPSQRSEAPSRHLSHPCLLRFLEDSPQSSRAMAEH